MKKRYLVWLGFIAFVVFTVGAATLTVNIPNNDVPRVSKSYGQLYNLGHDASTNEVSEITRRWIIERTKDGEVYANRAQFSPSPLEMQPTPTPTATATATWTPTPTETPSATGTATP